MTRQYRTGRHALGVAAGSLVLLTAVACGAEWKTAGPVALPQQQPPGSAPPAATPTPSPTTHTAAPVRALDRSTPSRLIVPKLKINSPIMKLGLNSDSTVEVPPLGDPALTGWYRKGPTPGEKGPAVILGHNYANGRPYVFDALGSLRRGDRIEVRRADGSVAEFRVMKVEQIPKSEFPTNKVYGKLSYPGIRLITCGGKFDAAWGHHLDNVIVFGKLVGSH